MDHRRDMLLRPAMQRRVTGQLGGGAADDADNDVAADATQAGLPADFDGGIFDADEHVAADDHAREGNDAPRASYLPASEDGSPRNQPEAKARREGSATRSSFGRPRPGFRVECPRSSRRRV